MLKLKNDLTLTNVILGVAAAAGASFGFMSDLRKADQGLVTILSMELKEVRKEIRIVRQDLVEKDMQIIELVAENRNLKLERKLKFNQNRLITNMLFHDPAPTWVKRVSTDTTGNLQFTMVYINKRYSEEFNVSLDNYYEKTDYEIYDPKLAAAYYAGDVKAFEKKDYSCAIEPVVKFALKPINSSNPTKTRSICKWAVKLQDGGWGVAGRVNEKVKNS